MFQSLLKRIARRLDQPKIPYMIIGGQDLKNIFTEKELGRKSVVANFATTDCAKQSKRKRPHD